MTTVNGTMNLAFTTESEHSTKDLSLLDVGYKINNNAIKDVDLVVTNLNGCKRKLGVSKWDVEINEALDDNDGKYAKDSPVAKKKYVVYSNVSLVIANEVYAQDDEEAYTTAQMELDDMLAIKNVHMSMDHVDGDVVTPKVCDFFINVDDVLESDESLRD